MYRNNKNDQWIGTLSYNFTKPISTKGVSKTLKIALLLLNAEAAPKTRSEVLKGIGVPKQIAERRGYNSCIFTALNWNKVIEFDKKTKSYIKGERFKEFLEYTLQLIVANPTLKQKHKKEYLLVLKATSNVLHFMMAS